jgi:hypothetical protein
MLFCSARTQLDSGLGRRQQVTCGKGRCLQRHFPQRHLRTDGPGRCRSLINHLGGVHSDAVELGPARGLEEVEVGLGGALSDVLPVVLADPPLHLVVLVRDKLVHAQVTRVRVVLITKVTALGCNYTISRFPKFTFISRFPKLTFSSRFPKGKLFSMFPK